MFIQFGSLKKSGLQVIQLIGLMTSLAFAGSEASGRGACDALFDAFLTCRSRTTRVGLTD